LKQISKDLQSLQLWRLQDERRRGEGKHEKDSHLAVLEEELRMLKEKDDIINQKFKKSHSHRSSRLGDSPSKEGSLRINDYYQQTLRKPRKENRKYEAIVDLPHFHGKENVEVYLD